METLPLWSCPMRRGPQETSHSSRKSSLRYKYCMHVNPPQLSFSEIVCVQMMDKHFTKTEVPFESLDIVFRSQDIHIILFIPKCI